MASADLKLSTLEPGTVSLDRKIEMNRSKNTGFADRLSAAAEAKKAQLERAARAKSEAEGPAAVERRTAREAIKVARDARIAERKATKKATKLAIEARHAAAVAAAQVAEAAAREAALKAEQEARDAEYAEQTAREAAVEAERQAARDARYAARKARKRKGR